MDVQQIEAELFRLQDPCYRDFQAKLIPTMDPERMIGVRTPALRAFAKALVKQSETDAFLRALPHAYFDEDQLHAAPGKVHVVLQQLVGQAVEVAGGAGRGLHHAVAQLEVA